MNKEDFMSVRMDEETRHLLDELARVTYRSRGGVVRWLIHVEAQRNGLVLSDGNLVPEIAENIEQEKV